jgi:hypothetical protein
MMASSDLRLVAQRSKKGEQPMTWFIFIIFTAFILDELSAQAWEVFWFNPGPAEYLLSLGFLFFLVALLLGPVVRIRKGN